MRHLFAASFVVGLLLLLDGPDCSALDAVDVASQQIGKPYELGAKGPDKFDCSGLVQYSYHAVGIDLPPDSIGQSSIGELISGSLPLLIRGTLRRGDLLFFDTKNDVPSVVTHVGLYEAGEIMISAMSEELGIGPGHLTRDFWTSRFLFARRIPTPAGVTYSFLGTFQVFDPSTNTFRSGTIQWQFHVPSILTTTTTITSLDSSSASGAISGCSISSLVVSPSTTPPTIVANFATLCGPANLYTGAYTQFTQVISSAGVYPGYARSGVFEGNLVIQSGLSPQCGPDAVSGQTFQQAFDSVALSLRAGMQPSSVPTQPWFENRLSPSFCAGAVSCTSAVAANFTSVFIGGTSSDVCLLLQQLRLLR